VLAARVVLMHQGGLDEILLGLGPLVIIAVLIAVARRQKPGDEGDDE